jgi:hypothetical protein
MHSKRMPVVTPDTHSVRPLGQSEGAVLTGGLLAILS